MELIMSLLIMLGGVAVFMFGMKQMSVSMGHGAGAGVQNLFKKISKNRVTDYGIGIGATVIVQSSSAVSIMTVGLANAGIVNVKNGSGMILGAKVGTTLTAFMFALSGVSKGSFSMSAIFAAFAFIGVLIMYMTSDDTLNNLALFITGFGMLFAGLELMETAIGGPNSILSVELQKVFQYDIMFNPICLVILGIIFTSIIQSSTAATGLFLIFLTTGVIASVDQSFFLIMGANIGTCSDGLLASISTNANGKRIAAFHLLSSVIGALVFSILLVIFKTLVVELFERLFPENPAWSLATFNLIYNVIYTLILLIFLTPLVNMVTKMIKDKKPQETSVSYIDERLLITPAVAIENVLKEVYGMAVMAQENMTRSFNGVIKTDTSESKKIAAVEYAIDDLTRILAGYFIKISAIASFSQHEKLVGGLHHVINDIERIGDHAVDLAKETNFMQQHDIYFIDQTAEELQYIYSKITEMFALTLESFQTRKTTNLEKIAEIHLEINKSINATRNVHIQRLNSNLYSVELSKSLYSVLFALERVANHAVNIAFSIRSDTGSKTEAFQLMQKDSRK
jgi:Na+/phosphate symporter